MYSSPHTLRSLGRFAARYNKFKWLLLRRASCLRQASMAVENARAVLFIAVYCSAQLGRLLFLYNTGPYYLRILVACRQPMLCAYCLEVTLNMVRVILCRAYCTGILVI